MPNVNTGSAIAFWSERTPDTNYYKQLFYVRESHYLDSIGYYARIAYYRKPMHERRDIIDALPSD